MKNVLLIGLMMTLVSSCARTCEEIDRKYQVGARIYDVTQYSGGQVVNRYRFRGMLNNSSSSYGYYWTVGDTLFEVSGDLVIKSWE